MSGPNRKSNGSPQGCLGALFLYFLLILFVGLLLKNLAG